MLTGYNTDIQHEGVVYHVQTEDKGLETPLILSLVYVGGAILASKRAPYDDLITAGFDEAVLAERIQRQHKLICAALHAGRVEDLKRMSGRPAAEKAARVKGAESLPPRAALPTTALGKLDASMGGAKGQVSIPPQDRSPTKGQVSIPPQDRSQTKGQVSIPPQDRLPIKGEISFPPQDRIPIKGEVSIPPQDRFAISVADDVDDSLRVELLEEKELRAGEFVTLRVQVSRASSDGEAVVPRARVVLKTLGTSFKPASTFSITDKHGVALIFASLPPFETGRAAFRLRAEADGETAELRRMILPA